MLDQSSAQDLPSGGDTMPRSLDDRRAILARCHQHETFSESINYGNDIKFDNEEELPSNVTNQSMWEDEEEPIVGNEKVILRRSPEDINTSDIPSLSSPDFK